MKRSLLVVASVALSFTARAGILSGVSILNIDGISESSLAAGNMTTARNALISNGAAITDVSVASFSASDLTGINILYAGLVNGSFSAGQLSAIQAFSAGGGGIVAVGTERACCFGPAFEQIANSFGLFGVGGDRAIQPSPADPTSPIVNGPFGVANTYLPSATGAFSDASVLASGANVVWRGADGLATIVTLSGAGRLFFFGDTNFMENGVIGGGDNLIIWENSFAFTGNVGASPEPGAFVLLGSGLAGLWFFRRRFSRN